MKVPVQPAIMKAPSSLTPDVERSSCPLCHAGLVLIRHRTEVSLCHYMSSASEEHQAIRVVLAVRIVIVIDELHQLSPA